MKEVVVPFTIETQEQNNNMGGEKETSSKKGAGTVSIKKLVTFIMQHATR